MRNQFVIVIVAASLWVGHGAVLAQLPFEVKDKLMAGEVVIRDAQMYAMASGTQRGTPEASQEWLMTRAMRTIANKLCAFEADTGRRLEADLKGVTLVSSETRVNEMLVIIKAPVQKPFCKVTVVEPNPVRPVIPVPTEFPRAAEMSPRLTEPSLPRAPDIVIRKFGGEY